MAFTDEDLKRLKEEWSWEMSGDAMIKKSVMRGLLARLEAAELIREYAGAPRHKKWMDAEAAWLKAAGK